MIQPVRVHIPTVYHLFYTQEHTYSSAEKRLVAYSHMKRRWWSPHVFTIFFLELEYIRVFHIGKSCEAVIYLSYCCSQYDRFAVSKKKIWNPERMFSYKSSTYIIMMAVLAFTKSAIIGFSFPHQSYHLQKYL